MVICKTGRRGLIWIGVLSLFVVVSPVVGEEGQLRKENGANPDPYAVYKEKYSKIAGDRKQLIGILLSLLTEREKMIEKGEQPNER